MPAPLIPEEIWCAVAAFLPDAPAKTGRPRLDNRAVFSGVLYVRLSEIAWNELSVDAGFGSGRTCLRRWKSWEKSGAWADVERSLATLLADGGHGESLAEQLMEWRRAVEDELTGDRLLRDACVAYASVHDAEAARAKELPIKYIKDPTFNYRGPKGDALRGEPAPARRSVAMLVLRRVFSPSKP